MPQLSPNSWKLLMLFTIFLVFQSLILLWWIKSPSFQFYSPSFVKTNTTWFWKSNRQ